MHIAFHLPTRGPRVGARGGISISRVGSRLPRRKGRKGSEGRELESGVRLHINSRWQTGVCQLPRRGSGVGAWQRPAQSGSSSGGLGSWGEFSRSSAPEWYHERCTVTHVSQDPSPGPCCVSWFHSRPSSCSKFLRKVNSRPEFFENPLSLCLCLSLSVFVSLSFFLSLSISSCLSVSLTHTLTPNDTHTCACVCVRVRERGLCVREF